MAKPWSLGTGDRFKRHYIQRRRTTLHVLLRRFLLIPGVGGRRRIIDTSAEEVRL